MRVKKSSIAAGLLIGALGASASAATITAGVNQNGTAPLQAGGTYVYTSGLGYDFSADAATVASLTTIDEIVVTLSISDGDSDVGDFDENNLFLSLDGINTGLSLQGFTNGQIVSLTLNQLAPATGAAILAALQADNRLIGGVFDNDVDGPALDTIGFPGSIQTFLDITGQVNGGGPGGPGVIPLPAAVVLAPIGACLAGMYSRRFRKAK
ncbi:MAG TPA: hypothetical protein VEA69_06815 [Tepidisphaeraceae bacterium]|nr:hypothetical protein [Tepidisphaeraceae bacterium]